MSLNDIIIFLSYKHLKIKIKNMNMRHFYLGKKTTSLETGGALR